jgi:hypothetical protein
MLEPLKILMKLWDKVEKSRMARRRKDFLQTVIALVIAVSTPLVIILTTHAVEIIKKALGF